MGKWLLPKLKELKCKSFLDVGCGDGVTAATVKLLVPDIYVAGMDISRTYIERCKERHTRVDKFFVGDIRNPIKGKYDVVYTHGVFIHIPHRDIRSAIENVLGIAKYGLFIESQGEETPGGLTYDPKEYWNERPKRERSDWRDHNTQYYFCHPYEDLFADMGYKFETIKRLKDKENTRIYCVKNNFSRAS